MKPRKLQQRADFLANCHITRSGLDPVFCNKCKQSFANGYIEGFREASRRDNKPMDLMSRLSRAVSELRVGV